MDIVVRPLSDLREYEEAEEVQMSAWGMGPRGVVPKEINIAINDNGGLVLGAFEGRKMVGMSVMIVGSTKGKTYMYSHVTGVSKEHQSKGIGYLLKAKQREIALERGYSLISWTFDPIIARNAYFNFRKLGVIARNYHEDYYGPMNDSINKGWPTDRVLCEWFIEPALLKKIRSLGRSVPKDAHVVIKARGRGVEAVCEDWSVDLGAPSALVEIPADAVALKQRYPEEGLRWREATRDVFEAYFGAGYAAVALLGGEKDLRYLLGKPRIPPNIFAEDAKAEAPHPRGRRAT